MLEKAAQAIVQNKNGLAFTGAGMSTASGIPDFRSPGGVWSRFDIQELAHLEGFYKNPKRVWQFFQDRIQEYGQAFPNAGHKALAELESLGLLKGLATQNIDMLHQSSGSKKVWELHGSLEKMECLDCGRKFPLSQVELWRDGLPYCQCQAVLKPAVVFFGEALPEDVFNQASQLAQNSGFVLVAGTSATVYPAAQLPYLAARNGSVIIEVNNEPTPLTKAITNFFLQGPVEEILPELVEKVKASL